MGTKTNEHILQELIDTCWRLIDKNEISGSKLPCLDTCQDALYEFKNCYLQNVSGSALLTDLLKAQQEIISTPLRFNGVAIEDIKRIFADYGIKYEPPF